MIDEDKLSVRGLDEEIPGLYLPKQDRSQQAMSRVLTQFHLLLKKQAFADIQMSAVSKASGVGVGTIYFRFSSKDHLLIALAEKITREEIEPKYQQFILPDSIQKQSLEEFLLAYFKVVSTVFSDYRYLLKPLTLLSRETSDEKVTEFLNRMNSNIQQKLSKNMMGLARRSKPAVTAKSVELAILWAGASLREEFLYKSPKSGLTHGEDQSFVQELSKALAGYLEA
ncbi:MAG: TetR/AcrR family transcriptional regulator [Arenicella sp.]|jgi:AcrR family transcriptional regulator|nr:TetR/AcrR family transcriptional regulator [Arenicella sp.]